MRLKLGVFIYFTLIYCSIFSQQSFGDKDRVDIKEMIEFANSIPMMDINYFVTPDSTNSTLHLMMAPKAKSASLKKNIIKRQGYSQVKILKDTTFKVYPLQALADYIYINSKVNRIFEMEKKAKLYQIKLLELE